MKHEEHEMFIINALPSGGIEWRCPICGRDIIFQDNPSAMIIVEKGDVYVSHYGQFGVQIVSISAEQEDPRLDVWKKALGNIDLESLGDDK